MSESMCASARNALLEELGSTLTDVYDADVRALHLQSIQEINGRHGCIESRRQMLQSVHQTCPCIGPMKQQQHGERIS